MKVREVMTKRTVTCELDASLATAAQLMSKNGCGFLPVIGEGGNVIGVITDRDICVALGTRGQKSSDVTVRDVVLPKGSTFPKLFTATVDDDVHCVLKTMRIEKIRRVPIVDPEGQLEGVLSIDDLVLRACRQAGKRGLSCKDVAEAYQAICRHSPAGMRPKPAAA